MSRTLYHKTKRDNVHALRIMKSNPFHSPHIFICGLAVPPTGHPERKSKFCDNEIPSPTVPPLRVRQAQNDPLSQNRHRRDLVGAETNAFGIRL